jgi:hypothetical protein
MTLIRVTLPSLDAEIEVFDEHSGSRVRIRGGESAFVELRDKHPLGIISISSAQRYRDTTHDKPAPAAFEFDSEQRRKFEVKCSYWPYPDGTFNKP